jgi:hypothetical protein
MIADGETISRMRMSRLMKQLRLLSLQSDK